MYSRSPSPHRPATATLLARLATLALCLWVTACDPPPAEQAEAPPEGTRLVVFAPTSLEPALAELAPQVEKATGLEPEFHFADSSTLVRQVEAAENADLVLVSGDDALTQLTQAERLNDEVRRRFLANRLVVVAHPDSGTTLSEARELETLAYDHLVVGDPRGVPVGVHAKAFLQSVVMPGGHTLWQAVGERVSVAENAAEVLAMVAANPDSLGVVYASNAAGEEGVRVVYEVPADLSPRIRYHAAAVRGGRAGERAAAAFLDLLESSAASRVFRRLGYGGPAEGRRGREATAASSDDDRFAEEDGETADGGATAAPETP